jgi:hypothetical protein
MYVYICIYMYSLHSSQILYMRLYSREEGRGGGRCVDVDTGVWDEADVTFQAHFGQVLVFFLILIFLNIYYFIFVFFNFLFCRFELLLCRRC